MSIQVPAGRRRFVKMHGLGNDFVVIDARREPLVLDPAMARLIADRRRGVGCDQLIVLEPPADPGADVFMRIYNPDASEAGACGNATRCIAEALMREAGRDRAVVQTIAGLLPAERAGGGLVRVDMGPARLGWRDVPLARECDTLHVEAGAGELRDPACCSMGNPHATFFVADADAVDLAARGPCRPSPGRRRRARPAAARRWSGPRPGPCPPRASAPRRCSAWRCRRPRPRWHR
ncbi:MAG: diaminopimelate epimerase, partial [Alphaproteobacteria bacterium]